MLCIDSDIETALIKKIAEVSTNMLVRDSLCIVIGEHASGCNFIQFSRTDLQAADKS